MTAKRTWIKVRRGLLEPKHREKLGARVWLYIYILDCSDWNTGKIEGWTDGSAAAELGMPVRTIQDQRQRLAEDGYISCAADYQCQVITIHNWINPREYSGEVYNLADGDTESSVGYGEFRTQGTESSVPIQSQSSVPLHSVTQKHIKESHKAKEEAAPPADPPEPDQSVIDPLAPATPQSERMFEVINRDREAKGRGPLKRFGSIQQREQTEIALFEIDKAGELDTAFKWAMVNGRHAREAFCSAMTNWAKNVGKPPPARSNGSAPKARTMADVIRERQAERGET